MDERIWVGAGFYFDLVVRNDLNNPLWQTYIAYSEPKFAEYLYGFWLYPQYLDEKRKKNDRDYDFIKFLIGRNLSYDVPGDTYENYKRSTGYINWQDREATAGVLLRRYGEKFQKTIDTIFYARRLSAIALALSAISVYFIILFIFGLRVALVTTALYGLNSLIITSGLRAHSEGIFLALFNTGILFLLLLFGRRIQRYYLYILFGIVAALCTQTKLNGGILLIMYNAIALAKIGSAVSQKNFSQIQRYVRSILVANGVFLAIFFSIDPSLYPHPMTNFRHYFELRFNTMSYQEEIFKSDALPTYPARIARIYQNFFSPATVNTYDNVFFFRINPYILSILNLLFFVAGLISLVTYLRQKIKAAISIYLFLFSFLVIQVVMGWYVRLNWDRYYVQLTFFFLALEAIGFWFIFDLLSKKLKRISTYFRSKLF